MNKAYADESGTSVLAFTSDIHNSSDDTAKNRLNTWLTNIGTKAGIDKSDIELFGFCGDMGSASANESQFWTYTQSVMTAVNQNGMPGVYTTGNHEFYNGKFSSTTNSVKDNYIKDGEAMEGSNYRIYCLGTDNWDNNSDNYTAAQVTALQNYLASVDNDKVVIILTHFPLHHWGSGMWGGRTTANADDVIDALNAATASGKKIVLLWGHNHSQSDTNYDEIFEPGSEIQWGSSSSDTKAFNFYYAAAGCMSDKEYGSGSQSVKGKGLILTINSKNQLSFAYYDESANNVTENGTNGQGSAFTEQDPVAVTGVSIDQTSATVEVGKTTKLTATVEPADATNKAVTWSSSDEGIARVGADGRVRGISEGTATITVTAGDPDTRAIYTASIDVEVTPKSGDEQYFVIMINNYALSSNAFDGYMSNSNGYEYHGLEAVTYNTNDPAPWSILWTLEEVDGVENGYYIKSYNGDYLSGTYLKVGSQAGYTGTLTVGNTQDIWIATSGIDSWQANGSTLQSTNASTNANNNKALYLGVTPSNESIDFFTVRSTSDTSVPRTSVLVEPEAIIEPVAVTGVEVEPATLEIEAGKATTLTANVLPAEADDKTVEWTSSDESVATVSNSGRVKGISVGTATITATTNDGGYADTCEVTVTPSSAPGIGYVITIDSYALSTEPADTTLTNSTNYHYSGLAGVPYTSTTEQTEEILWLIEPTEGGYYIKSQDGQYLNAVYEATTNPTGCNAVLKVDDTPDVWTFNGTLEDWVVSGSLLKSTNADKYLNFEMEGANLNLFDVRSESNAHSSSMIDPDNPAEVRYVETDSLSTGRDYIVAVTKDGSSVYAIDNVGGSSSADTGTATFGEGEYFAASGGEAAYIVTDKTSAVWNYNSSRYLVNNTRYLSRSSSSPYVPRASSSGSAVTYDGSNQRLSISYSSGWGGSGTTYYLTNSSGTFGLNTSIGSAAQVRVFGKSTVFNFKYVVQFTANGVNYQSSKYATDEIPVYSGDTPTRADSEQYSYTFSGWSSDGGQTIYGPDEALPAVTGPVTYVAQFTATPLEGEFLITFVNYDGTELQSSEYSRGDMPEYTGATPTRAADADYLYTFSGWTPTPAAVIGEATYTATYTQTPRTYGEPDWEWTGDDENGYTAATATFVTNDGGPEFAKDVTDEQIDVAGNPATCLEGGSAVYTASVELGGQTYTDSKTVTSAALGHDWDSPTYTWTDDHGSATAERICKRDGTHKETETVATTSEVTKPATCTDKGETTYTATFENEAFEAQTETVADIDALNHVWGEPTYEWAADNSQVTASRVCSRDESHTQSETVATTSEVTKPATCEAKGETTYTATFANEAFATQTAALENIDALGHDWGEWTAVEGEDSHQRVCANDSEHVETAAHEWGEWTETKAPTCEAIGVETRTCPVCGAEETRDVEALGHDYVAVVTEPTCTEAGYTTNTCSRCGDHYISDPVAATGHAYGEPTYTWDGLEKVTATMVCANDETHVITETATVTSEVTKPATCVEMGETTYAAEFENEAFETQTKVETDVEIDENAHAWGEPSYEWADDYSTVTAVRVCDNKSSHLDIETAFTTPKVTKPATCVEMGETTYAATFKNEAFETQTKVETDVEIDPDAHAWGDWTELDADQHQRECPNCGETETADHEWDDGVMTTEPTGDKPGEMTYTCEACGAEKTEELAAMKVSYRSGVEGSTSWQDWVENGALSGTTGKGLRMEGMQIKLENAPYEGGIRYQAQLQSDGWQAWKENGEIAGYNPKKSGGKRLEAVKIELTGEMAEHYDVWYHLQVQRFGWMAWAKNGEASGTVGYGFRVEAMEIVLAPKGSEAPTIGSKVASDEINMLSFVRCRSYDNKAWQTAKGEGDVSGTRKQTKTCIRVGLASSSFNAAGIDRGDSQILVRVYQDGKWSAWSKADDDEVGNKKGGAIRGMQVKLTGKLAQEYDIYYRAEVNFRTSACWLGWAKNGEIAGDKYYNLEQLQFSLIKKGDDAPPTADNNVKQRWVLERWPCDYNKPNYHF
uniref:Calcineurin-like phosphoesterase n=1 Tax=uncultured bacterium Contig224 TaxID=1393538 RepID=W0FHM8_9BACT|nr:calcineurin-like phosphoesterase [uncultured bacterium Contig224]